MRRRTGLALAAGVLAFAAVTTIVGAQSGAPVEFLVTDLVMGMTFVVSGLVAVWLRPQSPAGPVLLLSGALWFVGSYAPSQRPVVMHLGFAFEGYYDFLLAGLVLVLSSPAMRLQPRWLILALGGAMGLRSIGRLVFQDPALLGCDTCPPNPLAVLPSVAAFEITEIVTGLAIAGLAAAIGLVAIRRLIGASLVWRRVRLPVVLAGAIAMAAAAYDALEYAWTVATHAPLLEVAEPWGTVLPWAIFGTRTLVPIGFLIGTLRTRAAPGPLGPFAAGLERGDGGTLGGALRAALRDPSLVLVRHASDGRWSAEDGSAATPPGAEPGRAATLVGPAGAPVAALLHDPALLEEPELLEAVVRVLRLALDNERLQLELRDQLQAVTESRERIVRATEDERRRVERDLHDGAQQRLIAVTLALQQARTSAESERASSGLREQLDAAAEEMVSAISELRELARGIHPAILDDAGLEAAVAGLARRAGIPVDMEVRLDGRLPRLVEATAYFTVAEALTNAQRHAHASRASVRLAHAAHELVLEVSDDGRGGADPDRGSGLRGLEDRVAAVGGRLEIHSAPERGTRVRATLPTG